MQAAFLEREDTHNLLLGYIIWLFGFTGAHRFYYGRPVTGTIWFCTLGLFGVGWILDAFLIPSMERSAERRYVPGRVNYSLAWILLTYVGFLGIHRFYMGKIWTGLLYLLTGGLGLVGVVYDFWTLNGQVSEANQANP
ncbi:MAG: TM2 domain-containing protein [Deltaproteobacteria bacterium]|nr:TM2 domain-containing protein [Deltaproteobacteria bacterium]